MRCGRHLRVWIGGALLALVATACAGSSGSDESEPPAESAITRASVYACADFDFSVKTEPEQAHLWLPPRFGRPYLRLPRVRTASGAKYADADVMLWTKGEEALLEVGGETFAGCLRDPARSVWEDAKLRGVDFRAVGNEPPWLLEITRGGEMRMVTDYGAREVSVPTPDPETEPGSSRTSYASDTPRVSLRVELEAKPCTDPMSGERFETSVTVVLDDEFYRGCGRPLH